MKPGHSEPTLTTGLYEPFDFIVVRTPCLPVEFYLDLNRRLCETTGKETDQIVREVVTSSHGVELAIAVGSRSLWDALFRHRTGRRAGLRWRALLRYLVRMSTRPTPFGMFSAVGLADLSDRTDLRLADEPFFHRTRPDMGWLLRLAERIESSSEVREALSFFTNPAVRIFSDRAVLADSATGEAQDVRDVSIKATTIVRHVLAAATRPIRYTSLRDDLLQLPGATAERVRRTLHDLIAERFLLSTLRPPLTQSDPANRLYHQLRDAGVKEGACHGLGELLAAAQSFDSMPDRETPQAYVELQDAAMRIQDSPAAAVLQVDTGLKLADSKIGRAVAEEAIRAAETLLRLTPYPSGPPRMAAYRQAFVSRFGSSVEVPLLDLLDPKVGLGPLAARGTGQGEGFRPSPDRSSLLLKLALQANRDRQAVVHLDDRTIGRLTTWQPSPERAPVSLDITCLVAANSTAAIDRGEFALVIGPNIGAASAGRMLGRFCDLHPTKSEVAFRAVAAREQALAPDCLLAELHYMPRKFRSANVVIRPSARDYEIVVDATPGVDPDRVIPVRDLVVGVRNSRLYVRWPAKAVDVRVSASHMLNYANAPDVCQFLSEVDHDGIPQLTAFDWGPASAFPFLPRVQFGRSVLRTAEWRLSQECFDSFRLRSRTGQSAETLSLWRQAWDVPRYVYLSVTDNRLLLDLENSHHCGEVAAAVSRLPAGRWVTLSEGFPGTEESWLSNASGRYCCEFVVSMSLRPEPCPSLHLSERSVGQSTTQGTNHRGHCELAMIGRADRYVVPGGNWLFLKLYGERSREDALVATVIRPFVEELVRAGIVAGWFFIRYSDPSPHIRLRFSGERARIVSEALPMCADWGGGLTNEGLIDYYSIDTYEREVERYGGVRGVELAERLFDADSTFTANLLALDLGKQIDTDRCAWNALTMDLLLAGLGLDVLTRSEWLQRHIPRHYASGKEYSTRSKQLRNIFAFPEGAAIPSVRPSFTRLIQDYLHALRPIGQLIRASVDSGQIFRDIDDLFASYLHLHSNRVLGVEPSTEELSLGLLRRTRLSLAEAPL